MDEQLFTTTLAEFTAVDAPALRMDHDLREIGLDSVGAFEFLMRVEDLTGRSGIELDEGIETVQDLYDAVVED